MVAVLEHKVCLEVLFGGSSSERVFLSQDLNGTQPPLVFAHFFLNLGLQALNIMRYSIMF